MQGQMDFNQYLQQQHKSARGCSSCACRSCLLWWSSRCSYGKCYDDKRAIEEPYDKVHPDKPPRTGWSNWKTDQAFWCRGGTFYPITYCEKFIKYAGCEIKECLTANVAVFQDGYIECSLVEHMGCEACYREFEKKNR